MLQHPLYIFLAHEAEKKSLQMQLEHAQGTKDRSSQDLGKEPENSNSRENEQNNEISPKKSGENTVKKLKSTKKKNKSEKNKILSEKIVNV